MSKTKEFHRPENWSNAHQLLKRSDVHTIPLTVGPRPTALNDIDAEALVDLEKLQLNYIKLGEDGRVHIGAMSTLQDLYLSDLLKEQANGILVEAAYFSATLGLRNLATLAGAITNPENPPDISLVLMAMDAVVTVQKDEKQTRKVALVEWMKDCSEVLLPGEVIREVSFASTSNVEAALVRINRTPRDKAIVAAAAVLQVENDVCIKAGVVLAGANPTPVRLQDVESLLTGKTLSPELFDQAATLAEKQAKPVGDYRGSITYRKAMAAVLTKRALIEARKASK
jgi:carbon-monoxide dehydrogenase medium subunit